MIRNQNEFDYNYLTEFIASVRAGRWRCQKTTRKQHDQTRQIVSSSKTTRMRALKFFLVKLDEKLIKRSAIFRAVCPGTTRQFTVKDDLF